MEEEVRLLPQEHTSGGWKLKQIKRGEHAVMYEGHMPGTNLKSYEVWHIRERKATVINVKGKEPTHVPRRELKPTNEDYPYWAHQFIVSHYHNKDVTALDMANKRFEEYETGVRPLLIDHLHGEEAA